MNLRDLRYLVALADERHFGKAAERCFVSQPTLSAQVRKLEEYLGVPLVERQPKRVALTATGAKIVQRARLLLQEADAIVELAKTDRDPLAGPLKLALIPTVGPYLLPHIVGRLRRELPRLKLMLYEYQTAAHARATARGRDRRRHSRAARGDGRPRSRAAVRRALRARRARLACRSPTASA